MNDQSHTVCAVNALHNAGASLASKYEAAWRTLNCKESTVPERCHAYVWLGHRVIDGAVQHKDWRSGLGIPVPSQIENPESMARWSASVMAVTAYVDALKGGDFSQFRQHTIEDFKLSLWPCNLTSFVRMMAVTAYDSLLNRGRDMATAIAVSAMQEWNTTMQAIDLKQPKWAQRYAEMQNDSLPLQVLAVIANTNLPINGWIIGMLEEQPKYSRHWWDCIKRLEIKERALFSNWKP